MKRGGGGRGWGVSRTQSLWLCCAAELSEGTSFHTGSAVLVHTHTSYTHGLLKQTESSYSKLSLREFHMSCYGKAQCALPLL